MMISNKTRKIKPRKILKLPKNVRDELRLTCALRGYSSIMYGVGKKLSKQHLELSEYYDGKAPHRPSQIKMLCEAQLGYIVEL